jgi:predicted TIM-barrel fold metal-dependent hydrolase
MSPIARIVDAHIHLWDPALPEWYPLLVGKRKHDMGDISGMCRRYDQPTYFSETAGWNVEKFVHVAAASAQHTAAETAEMDARARTTGHPDAIIGGIVPGAPIVETQRLLDDQMESPRFRGVRPMGGPPGVPDAKVLAALVQRDLIFELLVRPGQLESAASALAKWEALTVVVEHAGWPQSGTAAEFEVCKRGLSALAGVGPNVHCKLSGLSLALRTMDAAVVRPWIEHAIDVFGVERSMFASNFPVDGLHGSFHQLYSSYDAVTADLSGDERDRLFAANAERLYRC